MCSAAGVVGDGRWAVVRGGVCLEAMARVGLVWRVVAPPLIV